MYPAQIYIPRKHHVHTGNLTRHLCFMIGVLAWLLISYALMGPRTPLGMARRKIEINDIYFVVDVSRSMLAEDFVPNRLEVAKSKIVEFVELRPTDRIGVIIFSDNAFTLMPLSTDLNLVKAIVKDIKVGMLGMGTNIGDALGLGVARGANSSAKNKVIILLTDGVSNVGKMTPIQAAKQAKKQGIKVYTIGIGKTDDKRVLNAGGVYQRLPGGSIDLKTLKEISAITGGKSFYAASETALMQVLSEIQQLEKTKIESSSKIVYDEHYYKFLFFGMLLLISVEVSRRWILREAV